jgi:glycosyltransferase involved in cell wall biosynthesis
VERPAFSVVMAAHDSAATIGAAIASVRLQTREDWELVVVDDGSADGTPELAASVGDDRVRVLRQENRGPAAARNAGIAAAAAPVVCTLDSDDLWLPGYLEAMGEALVRDPGACLAYTDAWVLDDATGRIGRASEMSLQEPPDPPPGEPRRLLEELLRRNFVYNSVAVRREAVLAVGGYDERLWIGEDWELWLRLAANGHRFVRAPGVLAVHRERAGSLASDGRRLVGGVRAVYRVAARDWQADDAVRALAAAHGRAWERSRRRRRLLAAALAPAVALRRRSRARSAWHDAVPPEVAALLAAVADADARSRVAAPAS